MSKSTHRKKLNNARKLRGIHFIDPDDRELNKTIKIALKKVKIPMEAAVCKLSTNKRPDKLLETDSEINGSNKIQKNMHAL